MFGKNEPDSKSEVDELLSKYRLESLSDEEKAVLKNLAENKSLVSLSSNSVLDLPFRKTLISQNWMILSELSRLNQNLENK